MLYMAECRFTDPAQEEAWNAWYGGPRLDELLSVPGFLTSQRFKAVTPADSPYLAIHTSPQRHAVTIYQPMMPQKLARWK